VLICTHMIACALAHREIMYHLGLHIHPSIAPWAQRPAIDVQCRPHHRSPRAVNLRLSVESENFLTTPLLDVIQPFSAWSSSSQFSFHHSNITSFTSLLSFILHMCPNKFNFLFMICCMMFCLHCSLLFCALLHSWSFAKSWTS